MVSNHTETELQNKPEEKKTPFLLPGDPERIDEIRNSVETIFPVVYHSEFYTKLFSKDTFIQLLCTPEEGRIIGLFALRLSNSKAINISENELQCKECCIDKKTSLERPNRIDQFMYVILLGVLEAHQGKGYGKILLKEIDNLSVFYGMEHIMLHVQVSNLRAIEFYYKSGYKLVKLVSNYYNNVYPKDAFLLRKCLYSH